MTMSMDLHPQYITNNNGEKTSVIISIEEYENMLEDFKDLVIVAQRKDEESISSEDFFKELEKDGLI